MIGIEASQLQRRGEIPHRTQCYHAEGTVRGIAGGELGAPDLAELAWPWAQGAGSPVRWWHEA